MSRNPPIKYPVVEVKIPQDVNYSDHVRRISPVKLDAEREKTNRIPYGRKPKMGRPSRGE